MILTIKNLVCRKPEISFLQPSNSQIVQTKLCTISKKIRDNLMTLCEINYGNEKAIIVKIMKGIMQT